MNSRKDIISDMSQTELFVHIMVPFISYRSPHNCVIKKKEKTSNPLGSHLVDDGFIGLEFRFQS